MNFQHYGRICSELSILFTCNRAIQKGMMRLVTESFLGHTGLVISKALVCFLGFVIRGSDVSDI